MKLTEIYDPEIVDYTTDKHMRGDVIGRGYYASVMNHRTDPHMVIKSTEDADPYRLYVKALFETGIWKSNPHFPRVYVKGNKDNNFVMEKLVSSENIEKELLEAFCENTFFVKLPLDDDPEFAPMGSIAIADWMCKFLKDERRFASIKDESLKEAVKWIIDFGKEKALRLDIHVNNFMWRRIPQGIQLVITDPYA